MSHLGIGPELLTNDQLNAVLTKHAFERLSGGRPRGDEDPDHHSRKGVSGDWRRHFTEAHVDRFKRLYNPLLLKTGYEVSENWGLDCGDGPGGEATKRRRREFEVPMETTNSQ